MSAIPRAHPRAVHAGLFRPPFAAPQRDPESRPKRVALPWLLRPGRPRSGSYRVPLGRGEVAQDKARRGARTMRARSLSAHGRAVSEPPQRPRVGAGLTPGDRGRVGALLFGYFLLGKQEKVTRSPGWRAEKHRDVQRFSRNPNQTQARTIKRSGASENQKNPKIEPTPSPPNPPLEGEG